MIAAADRGDIGGSRPPRSPSALIAIGLVGLLVTLGFASLCAWQIERRTWKLDLIARVEARLAAAPVEVPAPADWGSVTRAHDEYRRVWIRGRYLDDARTLVAASTDFGPGYWLMTPLRDDRGFVVLVNRGFVPSAREAALAGANETRVAGLLRITEPKGDLLRSNDVGAGRWYSRDVAAIAAARHLVRVAPFFVDADADAGAGDNYPKGGLTIVAFPNNHLVYAITWFALMVMAAAATILVLRLELRSRAAR